MEESKQGRGGRVLTTAKRKLRGGFLLVVTVLLVSASALAADVTPTPVPAVTNADLVRVVGGVDLVVQLAEIVLHFLTGNAYFALYLAVGLLSVGFGVFIRAKRTARR